MDKTIGIMAAAALWADSITLMIVAGQVSSDHAQRILIGWSLLSSVAAALVTAWQLIERSRSKVMDYLAHQDLRVSSAVAAALHERRPTSLH